MLGVTVSGQTMKTSSSYQSESVGCSGRTNSNSLSKQSTNRLTVRPDKSFHSVIWIVWFLRSE